MNKFDVQQHVEERPGFEEWEGMKELLELEQPTIEEIEAAAAFYDCLAPGLISPNNLHQQHIESTFIIDYVFYGNPITISGKLYTFNDKCILVSQGVYLQSIPIKDIRGLELVAP